ncbi:hypothetical protein ABBQ38_004216 [Trebouxia sp. C0009 RCD-2024]
MSLSVLSKRWLGRESQINRLTTAIRAAGTPPLFVYGPSSTGKTSIVRDVLRELQCATAYVNCVECTRSRSLLQSVLSQLKGRKRKASEGYSIDIKCENTADFLVQISGIAPSHAPTKYIVVDHVERLADTDLLAVLLKAKEITGANIGLILISSIAWGSCFYECDTLRVVRPAQLLFPAYEEEVLTKILALKCPPDEDVQSYVKFISMFMLEFARVSRRVEDLQRVAQHLYPVYMQPVRDGNVDRNDGPALYATFVPQFKEAVAAFTSGVATASIGKRQLRTRTDNKSAGSLDFELPYNSKLLLLAAYIASRNRPASDRKLFDNTVGKRRRKNALASDRQAEGAKEAQLRGPIPFPQERLLSYFWNLLRSEGNDGCASDQNEGAARQQQSAEVFMLLRSLVSLRLLSQAAGDMLDDGKYQCNIKDELAQKLAHNLQINLSAYLLYI